MATFDYGPIRNTAIGLLNQFGRPSPVKLLRAVNPAPADTGKPWRLDAPTIETFEFTAVVTSISDSRRDGDKMFLIPGDVATLQSTGLTPITLGAPSKLDRLESNGIEYGIVSISEVAPGADVIMWKVEAKAWPLNS